MTKLLTTLRQHETGSTVQMRLLVLLGVDVAACLVAGSAAGAFHFRLFNAIVAATAALSAVASLPAARRWFASTLTHEETPSSPSITRTKKILILAMAAGAIAYVGGHATFALFSAETANPGASMSSGTLVMGNAVNNGSVCMSSTGASLDNVNAACSSFLSLQNMAPGVSSAQAKLTIENDGSIDAAKLYLSAPYPRTTLNGALTSGVAVTSLTVGGFNAPVANGDQLTVSSGGHSQTFVASASAAAGVTTITVVSQLANFSYPVGARVDDTNGDVSASNADCYDAKTTSTPVSGATVGTALNFNAPTGNPLCSALLFWVQEQTAGGANYCWYGRGSSASPAPSAAGQCRTPTTATLSSTLSTGAPITLLPVTALAGNVQSGDSIAITEGANTATVTASGNAFVNGTSIPINSWTPNFAYTNAAAIVDTTALSQLNGDTTDTVANFDTGHPQTGRIPLSPVTGNNATNATATVWLNKHGDAGYQRSFYIGVYMPAPAGTPQNQLQGLVSTFGLNWHIDQ